MTDLSLPVLEMPRDETLEAYPKDLGTFRVFSVDYLAVPRPNITGASIRYPHGEGSDEWLPLTRAGACPSVIFTAELFSESTELGVFASEIRLEETDSLERRARVFAPVAARRLDFDALRVEARAVVDSGWFAIFEPALGHQRIAVWALDNIAQAFFSMPLPEGPGTFAVLRTESLSESDYEGLVYGITGYSSAWRHLANDWYGAVLEGHETEPIRLTRRLALDNQLMSYLAVDGDSAGRLTAEQSNALITLYAQTSPADLAEEQRIEVVIPCAAPFTAVLDGFADASLRRLDAGLSDTTPLLPGQAIERVAECPFSKLSTWEVSGHSTMGRAAFVVLSLGGGAA